MNVKQMIIDCLSRDGYDGLCTEDCGCGIDDLIPCNGPCDQCKPAYKRTVTADDTYWIEEEGFSVGETVYSTEKQENKK